MVCVEIDARRHIFHRHFYRSAFGFHSFTEYFYGFVFQIFQLFLIRAAHVNDNFAGFRYDVGRQPAIDHIHTQGGFPIQPSVSRQCVQRLCRQHDGVDSFLRFQPGMGALAFHRQLQVNGFGGRVEDGPGMTAAVHTVACIRLNPRGVHVADAITACLFRNGKADLDIPVGQIVFDNALYGFQHRRHTAFIVAAQGGSAIGIQHAVLFYDMGSRGGRYAVHVGFKKQPLCPRHVSFQESPNVSRSAAALLPGPVNLRFQAQFLQLFHQKLRFLFFIAAGTGYADQFNKSLFQTRFIYSNCIHHFYPFQILKLRWMYYNINFNITRLACQNRNLLYIRSQNFQRKTINIPYCIIAFYINV